MDFLQLPIKYIGERKRQILLREEKTFTGNFFHIELNRRNPIGLDMSKTRILIKPIVNTNKVYENEDVYELYEATSKLTICNISSVGLRIKNDPNTSNLSKIFEEPKHIDLYANNLFVCDFIEKYNNGLFFPNITSKYENSIPSQFCYYVSFTFQLYMSKDAYPDSKEVEKNLVLQINNNVGDLIPWSNEERKLVSRVEFKQNKYNNDMLIANEILGSRTFTIPEKHMNVIPESKIIEIDINDVSLNTSEIITKYNVVF
jgi:hypothetical protein